MVLWLECEKQSSVEDPSICCISFIKLPKGSSSSSANLVVSQTWQKLRPAWLGLTNQAHTPQKSCLIAAELKHGPKQLVYRDVDTQRDGNVHAVGGLQEGGSLPGKDTGGNCVKELCTVLAGKKQCLSSCSYADKTALKDVHPLPTLLTKRRTCCHMASPSSPPLSAPPGQENQPHFSTLIRWRKYCRHSGQSGSIALGCMESRTSLWLHGASMLESVSAQCRTLITRQGWGGGCDRLTGLKEEKICTPNLSSI